MRIFFLIKRSNYSYHHPLPLDHRLPLPFAAGPPRVFLEMNKIFLRVQSIYQTKKHISEKAIIRDNILRNKIPRNENSNLLPNTPTPQLCFIVQFEGGEIIRHKYSNVKLYESLKINADRGYSNKQVINFFFFKNQD